MRMRIRFALGVGIVAAALVLAIVALAVPIVDTQWQVSQFLFTTSTVGFAGVMHIPLVALLFVVGVVAAAYALMQNRRSFDIIGAQHMREFSIVRHGTHAPEVAIAFCGAGRAGGSESRAGDAYTRRRRPVRSS